MRAWPYYEGMNTPVTRLPYRLEPFGGIGWTVAEFATAGAAAEWFSNNRHAAMPCWRRMEVVDGQLMLVR